MNIDSKDQKAMPTDYTKLEQAARALLAHWDTPAWKYLKPTGDLMADLREALEQRIKVTAAEVVAYRDLHCVTMAEAKKRVQEMKTEQAEQEPVAEALRLSEEAIEYARQGGKIGSGIYGKALAAIRSAKELQITTPDVCGEVCVRAKLCYGCGKALDEANAKYAEQAEQKPVAVVEITYGREPECYVTGNIDDFPEGVFKLYTHPVQQAEQEPVAVVGFDTQGWRNLVDALTKLPDGTKLYAAPVRTKDLTDDEIEECVHIADSECTEDACMPWFIEFARAVIQEFRRKNGIV